MTIISAAKAVFLLGFSDLQDGESTLICDKPHLLWKGHNGRFTALRRGSLVRTGLFRVAGGVFN